MTAIKIHVTVPTGGASSAETCRAAISRALNIKADLAFWSYRIVGSRLYIAHNGGSAGGVMVISASEYSGGAPLGYTANSVANELKRCGYFAVQLDFGKFTDDDSENSRVTRCLALALEISARISPLPLFLAPELAAKIGQSVALVPSSSACQNYPEHLQSIIAEFGPEHTALDIDLVFADFTLARHGDAVAETLGEMINAAQVREILAETGATRQYFAELCINYATYSRGTARHIVIFDDEYSLRCKLQVAGALGIEHVFLKQSQLEEILGQSSPLMASQ